MIKSLLTLIPLLITSIVVSSCNDKNNSITAPQVVSVQIISLRMGSQQLPELGKTFFSIDHRKGEIYNAIPLPYEADFDKVKFDIGTVDTNTRKVFVGNEERKPENDSVSLKGWQKGVSIEITNKDGNTSKTYKLTINRYAYNPLLFSWNKLGNDLLPEGNNLSDATLALGVNSVFMAYHNKTNCTLYQAPQQNPTQWQLVTTINEPIENFVTIGDQYLLALTAKNSLILYNTTTSKQHNIPFEGWASNQKAHRLMGGFILPGENLITACFVSNYEGSDAKEKMRYAIAKIDPTTATISSSTLGTACNEPFPYKKFATLTLEKQHYPLLVAIGGRTEVNSPTMPLWQTTTGLDWLMKHEGDDAAPFHTDFRPTLLYDTQLGRFYLFETATIAEGYILYYSNDGITWHKGDKAIMFDGKGENIGGQYEMLGYVSKDHQLYLLGGKTSNGTWLRSVWKGSPRIYEEQNH